MKFYNAYLLLLLVKLYECSSSSESDYHERRRRVCCVVPRHEGLVDSYPRWHNPCEINECNVDSSSSDERRYHRVRPKKVVCFDIRPRRRHRRNFRQVIPYRLLLKIRFILHQLIVGIEQEGKQFMTEVSGLLNSGIKGLNSDAEDVLLRDINTLLREISKLVVDHHTRLFEGIQNTIVTNTADTERAVLDAVNNSMGAIRTGLNGLLQPVIGIATGLTLGIANNVLGVPATEFSNLSPIIKTLFTKFRQDTLGQISQLNDKHSKELVSEITALVLAFEKLVQKTFTSLDNSEQSLVNKVLGASTQNLVSNIDKLLQRISQEIILILKCGLKGHQNQNSDSDYEQVSHNYQSSQLSRFN